MKTRVITSIVGIAILAIVLFGVETIAFEMVLAILTLIAISEVFKAVGFGKKEWYLFLPFVGMVLSVFLCVGLNISLSLMFPLLLSAFAIYLALCLIAHSRETSFEKLGAVVSFSGVITLCFYSLYLFKAMLLGNGSGRADTIYFILLCLCIAWGGDTGAYFAGRAFGKHKLAPIVSPKKTVEGAVGGVLGSILLAVILTVVVRSVAQTAVLAHISWKYYLYLVAISGVGSLIGIVGDLFASVVKRQHSIKDYGNIFPGHGGILDRFDSVLFISPMVAATVHVAVSLKIF